MSNGSGGGFEDFSLPTFSYTGQDTLGFDEFAFSESFQPLQGELQRTFGLGAENFVDPQAIMDDPSLIGRAGEFVLQRESSKCSPGDSHCLRRAQQAASKARENLNELVRVAREGGYRRGEEGGDGGTDPTSIDLEEIFGPLRAEIARLTEQQVQIGRADISAGISRATSAASEALAGTGLGRSGVAAGAFSGIAQAGAQRQEAFTQRARAAGAQAQLGVSSAIADKQFGLELQKIGMNFQEQQEAVNFRRQLILMRSQSLLMAAQNQPSFFEEFGPLFGLFGKGLSFLPFDFASGFSGPGPGGGGSSSGGGSGFGYNIGGGRTAL